MRDLIRPFVNGLALAALVVAPSPAAATTLDLSWDACTPVITNKVPTGSPPDPIVLVVRAVGQVDPHTGFEFRIDMEDAGAVLPDAWRFDLAGCPGEGFISIRTDPTTAACPAFQGLPATVQTGIRYEPYALPGPLGAPPFRFALLVSSRYPVTGAPPAGAIRSLVRVVFNHRFSVLGPSDPGINCGGFERNLCLTVHPGSARWFDASGTPVPFDVGQSWLTFRGECYPVPVAPTTWGTIKGQFRR